MPHIRYCARCQLPHLELTHCRSVDQWLCEECIIRLAQDYYLRTFLPSIIPYLPEEDPPR